MDEKENIYKKVNSVIREDGHRSTYIGEDDFVSLVKGGITINYHLKNERLDIQNIFRVVRRAQKVILEKLGHDITEMTIDIFDTMDEMRQDGRSRSRYASWIAGIYDGKIRVISEQEDEEPESLYILLTHEMVHLAVDTMSSSLCPYWLDEGLAVYLSQELPGHYIERFDTAIREDSTLPLDALGVPLAPDAEEDIRTLAYAQACSLTEYFIETQGWDTVKSVISQCVRRPIRNIFSDLGLNNYLLEQGWQKWLKAKSA